VQDPRRILKDIGRRIAEVRISRGLTQEQFAERVLGVSLKYCQAVEAGRENLTVASLVRLANKVRVPVAHLFKAPVSRVVRSGRPTHAAKRRGVASPGYDDLAERPYGAEAVSRHYAVRSVRLFEGGSSGPARLAIKRVLTGRSQPIALMLLRR
jgi:transcriptional regulator with XRE-family HTH domain